MSEAALQNQLLIYRATTLGKSLDATLGELIKESTISEVLKRTYHVH